MRFRLQAKIDSQIPGVPKSNLHEFLKLSKMNSYFFSISFRAIHDSNFIKSFNSSFDSSEILSLFNETTKMLNLTR